MNNALMLYDGTRQQVQAGEVVGRGGEAVVYRVNGLPNTLVKIYEPAPRANYARKLAWMVAHPPANPTREYQHASLAWPDSLLFDQRGQLRGYRMPFIRPTVALLDVFNPRRRAEIWPGFDRLRLHRVARNLAAALDALHQSGYVAGDLNESNVLVTPSTLVTLIDVDSFQVTEERDGKYVIHPCPVGKFEYTPPELQGKRLDEVIRLPEHDAFGLAVLIFQLLMEGSHPFRAQWLGKGEPPPLEARIAQGAFPYTASPSLVVLPPKNAPDINHLHPWLVELVRRSFVDGHNDPRQRPAPELWARAIAEAERSLMTCAAGHMFSGHLGYCPVCEKNHQSSGRPVPVLRPNPAQMNTPPRPAGSVVRPGTGTPHSPWVQPAGNTPVPRPQVGAQAAGQNARIPGQNNPGVVRPGQPSPSANWTVGSSPSSGAMSGVPTARPGQAAQWLRTRAASSGAGVSTMRARPQPWQPQHVPPTPQAVAPAVRNPGLGLQSKAGSRQAIGVYRWFIRKVYQSFVYGGVNGALAGALPGLMTGLTVDATVGAVLPWSLLAAMGGAAAGLTRGWKPGYRVGAWVDQNLGWQRFWQGVGIFIGAVFGLLLGLPFVWLVFPVIIGPLAGAKVGQEIGKKIWMLGTLFGWEHIWAGVAAVSTAAIGWVIAGLIGASGVMSALGPNFQVALEYGGVRPLLMNMLAGAFVSALGGFVAGTFSDFVSGMLGLTD